MVRYPFVSCMNGGSSTSTSPLMEALRSTTAVGPGRPLMACLMASWEAITASFGDAAMAVYLVVERNMPRRSGLPCSPATDWFCGCRAFSPSEVSVRTTMGEPLEYASIMPNSALEPMKRPVP